MRALALFAAIVLTVAVGPSTSAQLFEEVTATPLIHSEALEECIGSFDLPRDYRIVIQGLFDAYERDLAEKWLAYRHKATNLQGDGERRLDEAHRLRQEQRRFAEDRLDLFVSEVEAVLADSPHLLISWEDFTRRQWRNRTLSMLRAATGNPLVVDLIAAARRFDLSDEERTGLDAHADIYYARLDAVLEEFFREYMVMDDRVHRLRRQLQQGDPAARATRNSVSTWYQSLRKRIYDLNMEQEREIERLLAPVSAENWRIFAEGLRHNTVYRPSPFDRIIERLRTANRLPQDAWTRVEDLYSQYQADRAHIRFRLSGTLDRWMYSPAQRELEERYRDAARAAASDRTVDPVEVLVDNPVVPLLREWLALERRYAMRLRTIVGPDLQESLPIDVRWLLRWDEPQR